MTKVDFGHFVAAGGGPAEFLSKFHGRISSFHMKEACRRCPTAGSSGRARASCVLLQMVKKNNWTMPTTIELEYDVPQGSDAVKEVQKCLDYCKRALR